MFPLLYTLLAPAHKKSTRGNKPQVLFRKSFQVLIPV